MERINLKQAKRIVVKVGTSTLTYDTSKLNYKRFDCIARVLADLVNQGKEVILVSSGAISTGVGKMHLSAKPESINEKQAVAAVGQCELMNVYARAFSNYNTLVAQLLLTNDVIENEVRKHNVTNTFITLLDRGIIPIVNENDSVSTEEINYENDMLSSIVAVLTDADLLIILSDIDGLYNDNPKTNPNAVLIDKVYEVTDQLIEISGGSGSNRGTGGMRTKIKAADNAIKNGINTIITNGAEPDIIYDILEGRAGVGTFFVGRKCE